MTLETTFTKEQLFKDVLVPTGQMLEMLLSLLVVRSFHSASTQKARRRELAAIAHTGFDALNLASCYAVNPTDGDDLKCLSASVESLGSSLLDVFQLLVANRNTCLHAVFERRPVRLTAKAWQKFNEGVTAFTLRLPSLVAQIHFAIGYSAEERSAWLERHTRTQTPLTANGRVNRWRTFVRNTSWSKCITLLGFQALVRPDQHVLNRYSSRAGIATAQVLWKRSFNGAAPVAPNTKSEGLLPAGVTVGSTADGMLEIRANLDPKLFLTPDERRQFKQKSKKAPDQLFAQLAMRSHIETCDLQGLPAAVEKCALWLREQLDTRQQVVELFQQWTAELRDSALLEKLNQQFTEEEQRHLADILERRKAGAAVRTTA